MKTSLEGKIEIVGHEGICLSKYKDSVGVWTIGVGTTKSDIPDLDSWPIGKTLTMQQAIDYFEEGLTKYEKAVTLALTKPVTQEEFDALVSWCYNVGVGWVKKSTVVRLLNTGNASNAALYQALMMYDKPKEIIKRRAKEARLLTGQGYQNKGRALVFPVSPLGRPLYGSGEEVYVKDLLRPSVKPKEPEKAPEKVVEPVQESTVVKTTTIFDVFKNIFKWKKYS